MNPSTPHSRSSSLRIAPLLLSLAVVAPVRLSLAGESFLDRNAGVHDAVPYGRSVELHPDAAATDDSSGKSGSAPTPTPSPRRSPSPPPTAG